VVLLFTHCICVVLQVDAVVYLFLRPYRPYVTKHLSSTLIMLIASAEKLFKEVLLSWMALLTLKVIGLLQ